MMRKLGKLFYSKYQAWRLDQSGAVLVIVSLVMIPIILLMGVSMDTGVGLMRQRDLQMAVDAAAQAGAVNGKGQTATITTEAQKIFAANTANLTGITGPSVSVDTTSGLITVSASIVVSNMFMRVAGISTSTYTATGTALGSTKKSCIYSLNTTATNAVYLTGTGKINTPSCGVYVNSSNSSAVRLEGSANITADSLSIVGNYTLSGVPTITTTKGITTGAAFSASPVGTIAIPAYSSCTITNYVSSTYIPEILNPGVYCNGMNVGGNGRVTLNPGVYIIDGGDFIVGNSAQLTGNNVTIILTKKLMTSSSYPTINFSGSALVTLSAPTGNSSNAFNGIAIYQDPNAPNTGVNYIAASAAPNITGIMSFPNQLLDISGNVSTNGPCSTLVVGRLNVSGSASYNCSAN